MLQSLPASSRASARPIAPCRNSCAARLSSGSLDDALDYERELREAFEPTTEEFTVPTEWEGFPGIAFGGFVAGAVLVAAAARSEKPRPLSFFSRFYRPVPIGRPVKLSLASERSGRTVETLTARLDDGERLLAPNSHGSP